MRACVRRQNSKLNVQTFQLDLSKRFSARSSNISARRNVSCVRQTFQLGKTFCAFVKHFSSAKRFVRSSNISARRQTFQLDFVKHFGLTLGSAKCRELSQLICRDVNFFAEQTNERTNERTFLKAISQMFVYHMIIQIACHLFDVNVASRNQWETDSILGEPCCSW